MMAEKKKASYTFTYFNVEVQETQYIQFIKHEKNLLMPHSED